MQQKGCLSAFLHIDAKTITASIKTKTAASQAWVISSTTRIENHVALYASLWLSELTKTNLSQGATYPINMLTMDVCVIQYTSVT